MISKINKTLFFCVLLSLVSCKTKQDSKTPRWLDDIQYDSKVDKKNFVVCDDGDIYQYFNLGDAIHYNDDKPMLINSFLENYAYSVKTDPLIPAVCPPGFRIRLL